MNKTPKYVYSLNEEDFEDGGDSREDALDAAESAVSERSECEPFCDYDPGQPATVWTGRCVKTPVKRYAMGCADLIIDHVRDAAYEDVGEHSEGWLDATTPKQDEELREMIAATFDTWCKKHGLESTFYSVVDVQKHEIIVGYAGDVTSP